MKIYVPGSLESFILTYESKNCSNPEEQTLNVHLAEDLKSHN
jgi:hypothetical protein